MTGHARSLAALLQQARDWFDTHAHGHAAAGGPEGEEPLRAALFSSDQMVAHGRLLAGRHRLSRRYRPDPLLARLADNQRTLEEVAAALRQAVARDRTITPAAEWLLDNMYLIDEEIRTARRHLPRGYSRELPRLAGNTEEADGTTPRVYDLALEAIAHTDGHLGRGTLSRFLAAYQGVQPLKLGELWAFPIMLRLALIENLRRVAVRVATSLQQRDLAQQWAERMLQAAEDRPSDLILVIADMARSDLTPTSAFVAEFARRLQGQGAALALPLTWMEQRLADIDETIEHLVHVENQTQAAAQVSVANSIGSLRLLGATHWPEFVETLSSVEQVLREDPSGVYGRMDFGTRDQYRHAVEAIARIGPANEPAVAQAAVELARNAAQRLARTPAPDGDEREAHVGYWLVGPGRATLERAVDARRGRFAPAPGRSALPAYIGSIALFALLMSFGPLHQATAQMPLRLWSPLGIAVGLLLVIATSQLAISLVNWLVTLAVTPHALPRMDYTQGIAPRARTLVVVPTLLGRPDDVDALVDALEVRYLANRDPHLQFALLTDLRDAPEERMPGDDELVERAAARIEALNRRYDRPEDEGQRTRPFLLLHRPRRWNAKEGVWMGHERKRGKLADLNALLRARPGARERFERLVGDTLSLQDVRYVITLDTDTQLPRDAAAEMISAMDHPLNRPRWGEGARADVVVEGYGILQPRVGVNLPSVRRSGYARIFGGEPGIDPYTRAVSDVYQDLFGEGSFIGKGIYDVDAFERAAGSMPENRILSHDLIEGCYARSGLLSDVQLIEDVPARYAADMARRHRWVRGDWQLIGWLRRRLHLLPGKPRNPLSALSRWKLLDNLRRSLVPTALVALAVLGWAWLPEPFMWTLRIVVIVGIVPFAAHVMGLLRTPLDWMASSHSPARLLPMGRQLLQIGHTLACLPTEAAATLDAIGRALWRMVRGRRLLEWTASSDIPSGSAPGSLAALRDSLRTLWAGPVAAVAIATLLAAVRPWALPAAAPLLLLWLWSPVIVWWADRPLAEPRSELDAAQRHYLRRVARRTWAFFETFVGAADNHLPPDNVQMHPVARVAHRTSPTNIGFSLLANLTARDLGYATLDQVLTRVAATVTTLERLERHRGHFYNWYDTQSLLPLAPRYISTVDSGNLVAQLMTLRMALLALPEEAPFSPNWCHGLADLVGLVRETLPAGASVALVDKLDRQLAALCVVPPTTAAGLKAMLETVDGLARQLVAAVEAALAGAAARGEHPPDAAEDHNGEALRWAQLLVAQCQAGLDEFNALGGLALPLPEDATDAAREEARKAPVPTLAVLAAAGVGTAAVYADRIAELARRVDALTEMEQQFLYDDRRHLMSIGYNVDERRLDASHYDLLASEARLGIFAAIARGQLPQDSWFALGRLLTSVDGDPVLMSWSGSMFEYLMPPLIMPEFEHTLLAQTSRAAVRRQIEYGRERGVPWGISESGYNATDTALNYQYRAFGVPGLGLKRGLGDELVIAPYATAMATIVEPVAACANLQRLQTLGAAGEYGFHEAVDYTPMRVPRGQTKSIVRSFMAHHQGMSLLAIEQALGTSRMQAHFAADPRVQATLTLLHERVPKDVVPVAPEPTMEPSAPRAVSTATETALRVFTDPQTPTPEVQLLSNGSYHVMVTQSGAGYSRWRDLAVTRWREDTTRDDWGSFCYLRDLDTGEFWSTAYQPTVRKPEDYQAIFTEGRAEFRRRDAGLDTHVEIAVSPEDAIELRRVRLKNTTRRRRRIELTSYCEVVLMTPAADVQHPAFGKLFVQTEIVDGAPALLANRRPRAEKDPSPWMFHLMAVHAPRGTDNVSPVTHETDRARFIGRGQTLRAPAALLGADALPNTQGSVLDPCAASRCTVVLEPDQTVTVDLVIGVADQREDCLGLIEKYRDRRLAERVFELAWTHSQVLLRQLNASETEAQMFARLAGAVLFSQGALRADPAVIRQNRRGQSGLWGYAISGDLPIVLVQISDASNLELVRQLVVAHAWWRLKGLAVDLVIWNEERDVYRQRLNEQVMGLIAAGVEAHVVDRPGGIFVRQADQIPHEDRVLLLSVARAVLSDRQGTLAEQLARRLRTERRSSPRPLRPGAPGDKRLAPFVPTRQVRAEAPLPPRLPTGDLALFNGYGGYAKDGREYVVAPPAGVRTPAPWANVIANPDFGTVVSEAGAAYTWAENAHEWRLTPWHNDPVSDPSGETFHVRDEETGAYWMPCGTVASGDGAPGRAAIARHGFGYSSFEQSAHGIHTELRVFCAIDAPVKFSVLTLRNDSGRPRKVSVTGYVEWVLGSLRPATAPHIVTDHRDDGPATARNPYSGDHAEYTGFFDVDAEHQQAGSMTCDRTEFIGRNGSLLDPVCLKREGLSGRFGAAIDPCAAFQVPVTLLEGESRVVVFRLGMGRTPAEAERIALQFRGEAVAQAEFERVQAHWRKTLGAVQVRSPDAALNALANGWLVYQTIACRLWARSGYYQSGGAFGFRDQLQDAMALVHTRPELLRAQLLLAASRQFEEGDVQHWWHPPQGRGVRTHISDDYLWLPMALCRYVQATGDLAVLRESVPFLEGRPLKPEDESYFDLPVVSHRSATLYEHAALAVKHGLRTGEHGLPLIGGGDWNDGMNLIGEHGKGESVWMGFFVCEVLREFAGLARAHHDEVFARTCEDARARIAQALEEHAWDGAWYRRAYFDDGTPLGTAGGVECQIDSIAQSWAVLSGIAPRERARQALDSLGRRLVNPQQRIVKLLDPPFDGKGPNPGYIAGYVPGVRENGGQYTHGAIWAAMAFAAAGDVRRAWDVVDMINPVNHARTPAEVAVYKVEPYVMTADVYSVAPHTGRGGWSWYTGSAGWMYRLLVEAVLGLRREHVDGGPTLLLDPRVPPHWTAFEVDYVHGDTLYRLQFSRAADAGAPRIVLDGRALEGNRLPLVDDARQHSVQVALPATAQAAAAESAELLL
jgi:cellobiose phosphorylase